MGRPIRSTYIAGGPLQVGDIVVVSHIEHPKWWQFLKSKQKIVVVRAGTGVASFKERL